MILQEDYTLYNGTPIPKLAIGTWQMTPEEAEFAVETAIHTGYRHIDTAAAYENEEGVGRGIQKSGARREDLYITTKIPAHMKTYAEAVDSIQASLQKLQTDYLDCILIHAPKPWAEMFKPNMPNYFEENLNVWQAMEEALARGEVRAIGVSNFDLDDIDNILSHGRTRPAVNQIKVHVGHTKLDLIQGCKDRQILVTAYSPMGTGRLLHHPTLIKMAEKYNVTVPQLCIRYDLELGLLPLPKSTHAEYIQSNAQVDFSISKEDMDTLLHTSAKFEEEYPSDRDQ